LLAADYAQVKDIVTDYISRLSAAEQAQIMGGNAIEFYKLA
jgi:L-fuconolactonase